MKVVVSQDVLARFRRRALRRYPKEYMESAWGRVVNGEALVFAFHPLNHKATRDSCTYEPVEIEEQREQEAPAERMQMLGTIHTHPDAAGEPSQGDWETARKDGDVVMGICQITRKNGRRQAKVRFYTEPLTEVEVRK